MARRSGSKTHARTPNQKKRGRFNDKRAAQYERVLRTQQTGAELARTPAIDSLAKP